MCTVVYIPLHDGFLLAQNRDVHHQHGEALYPTVNAFSSHKLLMPIDAPGKGSWFAVKDNGDAACLLNGAFVAHKHQPPYKKSRGLVISEWAYSPDDGFFDTQDYEGIEPFTVVHVHGGKLTQYRWDGSELHKNEMSCTQTAIWSSATLFSHEAMRKREKWYHNFLASSAHPISMDAVEGFLRRHEIKDDFDSLMLRRDYGVQTVSTTLLQVGKNNITMKYIDRWDAGCVYELIRS